MYMWGLADREDSAGKVQPHNSEFDPQDPCAKRDLHKSVPALCKYSPTYITYA